MTFTMPDVAETRGRMINAYREGLAALLEDATAQVPSGEWEGVPVVTRKALDEAVAAIFGQPVPMPDETWAEVHTPATVVVSAICPRCGLAQPIMVNIRPELLVSDDGSELRVKAKARGRTHICGQLPLPVNEDVADGQETFDLEDIIGTVAVPDAETVDQFDGLVAIGETLEEALARIERLDDFKDLLGSPAGQALLEALKRGNGSWIPRPVEPEA